MKTLPMPPRVAPAVLSTFLPSRVFESVAGDLLEEYRASIYSTRGRWRADLWYVAQVLSFLPSTIVVFAVLFSAQFLARTSIDFLVPTTDFHTRALVTTALSAGLLFTAGLWASWRCNSLTAGVMASLLTAVIAAAVSLVGAAILLAFWHDAQTMAAIRASGGLGEIFTMPLMTVVHAVMLGTVGGGISVGMKRLLS